MASSNSFTAVANLEVPAEDDDDDDDVVADVTPTFCSISKTVSLTCSTAVSNASGELPVVAASVEVVDEDAVISAAAGGLGGVGVVVAGGAGGEDAGGVELAGGLVAVVAVVVLEEEDDAVGEGGAVTLEGKEDSGDKEGNLGAPMGGTPSEDKPPCSRNSSTRSSTASLTNSPARSNFSTKLANSVFSVTLSKLSNKLVKSFCQVSPKANKVVSGLVVVVVMVLVGVVVTPKGDDRRCDGRVVPKAWTSHALVSKSKIDERIFIIRFLSLIRSMLTVGNNRSETTREEER